MAASIVRRSKGADMTNRLAFAAPRSMRTPLATMLCIGLLTGPMIASADVSVAGGENSSFERRVIEALAVIGRSEDAQIRKWHATILEAPVTIPLRPITDDLPCWTDRNDPRQPARELAYGNARSARRTTP